VLVLDGQGTAIANYYICRGNAVDIRSPQPNLSTYRCGDYQIVAVADWAADESVLAQALAEIRAKEPGQFTGPAWLFQMSLGTTNVEGMSDDVTALFGRIYMHRISL
jgi:hypothetical protein